MTEYTPTTEQVRDLYVLADPAGYKPTVEYVAEFNRWLQQVQAEAWEEGHSASEAEWMHTFDGHPVPEGELCPECSIGNPYRKDKTND